MKNVKKHIIFRWREYDIGNDITIFLNLSSYFLSSTKSKLESQIYPLN